MPVAANQPDQPRKLARSVPLAMAGVDRNSRISVMPNDGLLDGVCVSPDDVFA
jgi:hypothetical protein